IEPPGAEPQPRPARRNRPSLYWNALAAALAGASLTHTPPRHAFPATQQIEPHRIRVVVHEAHRGGVLGKAVRQSQREMHREAAGARPTLDAVDVDAGRVDHPQLLGKLQRPTSGNGLAQGSEQGIVDASQPEVLTIRKLRLRLVLAQLFPPGRRDSHG